MITKWIWALLAAFDSCTYHTPHNATRVEPKPDDPGPARVEYNGAILVCDEPVHDFGTFWIRPSLSHEFAIRNEGIAEGWFRVGYSFAGTMSPCVVRIEAGETIYVPAWLGGSIQPLKFRGHFEKSISLRVVPDSQEACVRCLSSYDSQQHATTCQPECFDRRDTSYCIRRPFDAACEAAP